MFIIEHGLSISFLDIPTSRLAGACQYIDFSKENALVERLPNTVQVRTLSKAYGLAGLRCGFAVAEADWVTKADQIRAQFGSIGNLTWGLEKSALAWDTRATRR